MKNKYLKALKTAFPYTIPIFAGSIGGGTVLYMLLVQFVF